MMFKRKDKKPIPDVDLMDYEEPHDGDVKYHTTSADYWLRCAGQEGLGTQGTIARATLAQAHALMALLAQQRIANRT